MICFQNENFLSLKSLQFLGVDNPSYIDLSLSCGRSLDAPQPASVFEAAPASMSSRSQTSGVNVPIMYDVEDVHVNGKDPQMHIKCILSPIVVCCSSSVSGIFALLLLHTYVHT